MLSISFFYLVVHLGIMNHWIYNISFELTALLIINYSLLILHFFS